MFATTTAEVSPAAPCDADPAKAAAQLDALLRDDRFSELLAAGLPLTRRFPADRRILLRVACALAATGRGETARAAFAQAQRLQPALASCHAAVGAALTRSGVLMGARAQLQEALRLDRSCLAAWIAMGVLQQRIGDDAAARGCLEMAVRLAPQSPQAHMLLALTLHRLGEAAACEAACAKAEALGDDAATACARAEILTKIGALDAAEAALERVRRDAPDHVIANRQLAALRLQSSPPSAAPTAAASAHAAFWRDLEERAITAEDVGQIVRVALGWFLLDRREDVRRALSAPLAQTIPQRLGPLERADPRAAVSAAISIF